MKAPWVMADREVVLTYSRLEVLAALVVLVCIMLYSIYAVSTQVLVMKKMMLEHEVRISKILSVYEQRVGLIQQAVIDKKWLNVYGRFIRETASEERYAQKGDP
jgi:uncharacterized membrane protein